MRKRFSIVIVHRNGVEDLLQALRHLMQACDPALDEVILVDNGSSDASLAEVAARYPQVIVIANGCNNGFAGACNQGIARAEGDYILLLNNDAFLPSDALVRLESRLREYPAAGIIAGQLYGEDGERQRSHGYAPTVLSEMGLVRRKPLPVTGGQPVDVETVVGACMAVRRAAIEDAGALDKDFFFYFEETEWCVRLRRKGWRILLDPALRITHLKGASTRAYRQEAQIEMLRSRLLYYRKVFSPLVAAGLSAWRILRLIFNVLTHGLWVLLTLGLAVRLRGKFLTYLRLLAWLAAGRPESWGLPDKCPAAVRG
ncbi:MAG: glycosyltransferase family 2 protein [Hydrogenophilaceae bacterium]|nr:glycosyltransferase family 2 protein [Hydrogenophilaceae bacterium]